MYASFSHIRENKADNSVCILRGIPCTVNVGIFADILFYKNSLISMAEDWEEMGDIKKFIPIGWLGYSGGYVLYEVSSHNIFLENMDVDGEVEDKPIANSLKELINNMNVLM